MIELKNVSKYYSNDGIVTLGLRNINLSLGKNEIVAITGDSGSGKSTLLNVICGMDTYDEGEMFFCGNETSHFNQNEMDYYRKKHIGFIYQNYNIIDSYTVLENVMLPMLINGKPYKKAKERALELIEKVGLTKRCKNKGTKLSGGEKQRCIIARALASECEILACDEPTGNLDSKSGAEIIKLIQEVAEDKLVLIVTHNYEEVEKIITRRIKISDGEVVEDYSIKTVENKEVHLNEKGSEFKLSFLLRTAWNNIKNTPKKTFFALIVFFFFSLLAFFLYLTCMQGADSSEYNPDDYFEIYANNRLIAFNFDHSPISKEQLNQIEDIHYENAFYEDSVFTAELYEGKSRQPLDLVYSKQEIPYTHITGVLPKEDEVYIIFPEHSLDKYSLDYAQYLNHRICVDLFFDFKFVGFGVSKYVNTPLLYSSMDLEDTICRIVYRNEVSMEISVPTISKKYSCKLINQNVVKPILYLPQYLEAYVDELELSMILKNLYDVKLPERFVYSYANYVDDVCYFSLPFDYSIEVDNIYEATIYASKPKDCIKRLEGNGLTVLRPSIGYNEFSVNLLLFYIYVFLSTLILLGLSFICYAILSKIYVSKDREYAILRSLGVLNKQMKYIVLFEMIFFALVASILAFITMYSLYFITQSSILNIVTYNTFGITILYCIVMLCFAIGIAKKFNKKLFKKSVQISLKGEVSRND